MKICTYFTEGLYEQIANEYIIPSAEKLGIDLYRMKVPSEHTWKKNTALKASCILSAMTLFDDDIVMIDADATFEKYPELFFNIPSHYDIAYHNLDLEYFWRRIKGQNRRELCSGTIMFRNNLVCKEILKRWIEENQKNPNIYEQKNLENLIKRGFDSFFVNIYQLPIEYLAIVAHDNLVPDFIKEPIIIHHQASRKTKRMKV